MANLRISMPDYVLPHIVCNPSGYLSEISLGLCSPEAIILWSSGPDNS